MKIESEAYRQSVQWRDRGYSVSIAHGLLAWRHVCGNVLSQPEYGLCHAYIATMNSVTYWQNELRVLCMFFTDNVLFGFFSSPTDTMLPP